MVIIILITITFILIGDSEIAASSYNGIKSFSHGVNLIPRLNKKG